MDAPKISFNGGELSPWLSPRLDLEKYQSGVALMENMHIVRYGGARRRGGFQYVAEVKDSADNARLVGFNFSTIDSVVVEFGDFYARFYKNGAPVMDGMSVYEIVTPYAHADVSRLQFAQRNDVIIITSPNYPPKVMQHAGDTDWSIGDVDWVTRPWDDLNSSTTTLQASAITGAGITITASAGVFSVDWVGSRVRLVHNRPENSRTQDFDIVWLPDLVDSSTYNTNDRPALFNASGGNYDAANTGSNKTRVYVNESGTAVRSIWRCIADYRNATDYVGGNDHPSDYPAFFEEGVVGIDPIDVEGEWEFETKGAWHGELKLQRSYDSGVSWETIKIMLSANDKNFLISETEEGENALYRVIVTQSYADYDTPFILRVLSRKHEGSALITAYTDAQNVTATVEKDFQSISSTNQWSEDAFNVRRGYPKACVFYEERLVLGGVNYTPQSLWLSRTNDFYNFEEGTKDDDAMKLAMAANRYDGIEWIVSQRALLVGTSGGEWAISSADDAALTPSNARARLQSNQGSEPIQPVGLNEATIIVQRKGRKVYELQGDAFSGFAVRELTMLADHVTLGGITAIDRSTSPDGVVYAVRGDGVLACMTYERNEGISGWYRYTTQGAFESVATIYGTGEDDEVWVVVRREIDGNTVRYVERLTPDLMRAEEINDNASYNYMDSAVRYEGVATDTITGLDHLEGETVQIMADGAIVADQEVGGGTIILDDPAENVVAGLPYTSTMRTMPLEGPLGHKKSVNSVFVRLRTANGAKVGQAGLTPEIIPARSGDNFLDSPTPTTDFNELVTIRNNSSRQLAIEVIQDSPLPCAVVAIVPNLETGDY